MCLLFPEHTHITIFHSSTQCHSLCSNGNCGYVLATAAFLEPTARHIGADGPPQTWYTSQKKTEWNSHVPPKEYTRSPGSSQFIAGRSSPDSNDFQPFLKCLPNKTAVVRMVAVIPKRQWCQQGSCCEVCALLVCMTLQTTGVGRVGRLPHLLPSNTTCTTYTTTRQKTHHHMASPQSERPAGGFRWSWMVSLEGFRPILADGC